MLGKFFKGHDLFIGRCFGDGLLDHFGRYGKFPIESRVLNAHPEAFGGAG